MKETKTLFNTEELNYFETQYFNKKELFFSKNKNKTEIHFIKNELKIIDNLEKERNDIYKLSDIDFYNYLVSQNNRYKKAIEESENKNETKKLIFNNHLKREKEGFAPSKTIDKRKEFYKIKLDNIQRNTKQSQENKKVLEWKGTKLEFSELVKALQESKLISPELKQYELFELMKNAFNVEVFKESDKLKEIRNRTKNLTPLINTLEINLTNWIKKKDSI